MRKSFLLAALAAVLFAVFTPRATAAPGDLDLTFGGTGKVTTAVSAGTDSGQSLAVQSNGKIVVAGSSFNGSNDDFAVVRYNADGSLDTTFNGTGKVTTAIGAGTDRGQSLAVQSDGKIVVGGYSYNGSNNDFAVVRYNADGSLDTTFNGTGKVTTAIGSGDDIGRSVVVQSNGKIVVGGYSYNGSNNDFAVVRYNADGSLDTTFNGTGKVTTAIGSGDDSAYGMALQGDGKIILAGRSFKASIPDWDFALVRYNADGTLDTSFNGTGKLTTAFGSGNDSGNSVVVQSDGKILVAGSCEVAGTHFAMARYNADGSLDTTFNGTGKVTTSFGITFDFGNSMAVQSNGKIVVAGQSGTASYVFALVRYNADGSLDTTFNGTGKVTTVIGTGSAASGVAIQSDGKIVTAGSSNNGSNSDFAVVRYLGDTLVPAISSVNPTTVPGSNSQQNFTINGANFDAACTVTLRNLTTGAIYPNRTKVTQTTSSITLNPNFSANPATWSVEVINPGNVSSGQYQFQVTGAATLVSVTVNGPSTVAAGSSTDYTVTATYSNGSTQDVTDQSGWSVTGGPSGTTMNYNTLLAGAGTGSNAHVQAVFAGDTATRSGTMDVAIGNGWSVVITNASATAVAGSNPQSWILNAGVTNSGTIPAPSVTTWKLDGGSIGTPNAPISNLTIPANKGQHQLQVTVVDANGVSKTASYNVAFNVPAPTEPPSTRPPDDPNHIDTVYGTDGHDFLFDLSRKSTGFLLITHGLNDSATNQWLRQMASNIEQRLTAEGKQLPNIALYNWETAAMPRLSKNWDESTRRRLVDGISNSTARLLIETVYDFQHIETPAKNQGVLLAAWLIRQINAHNIDPSQPIHLIGHSAGGFVIGEAANYLLQLGYVVDLVTMLDTPDPIDRNFLVGPIPSPGYVERYITSVMGIARCYNGIGEFHVPIQDSIRPGEIEFLKALKNLKSVDPENTTQSSVQPGPFYRRIVFPVYYLYRDKPDQLLDAHDQAYITYNLDTIYRDGNKQQTGFYFSPFLNGPKANKTGWNTAPASALQSPITQKTAAASSPSSAAITTSAVGGFSTFGTVNTLVNGYELHENDNVGISKAMAFSYGAIMLRFQYQFTTPGDGDFLGVRIGDSEPLYVGTDSEISEGRFVTAEIPLRGFANTNDTIIITLISRGNPNAVVQITNIELVESDDPDGDGLTTTQELALGTNPLVADTDGDGISDGDEVNIYHTNPLLADTDGDGIPDGAEIAAGTDPNSPNSYFRVTSIQRNLTGGFALTWPCVAGKSYQVWRSTDVTFANYDVIASGLEAVTSTLTYTDTSPPVITQGGVFYRVALGP